MATRRVQFRMIAVELEGDSVLAMTGALTRAMTAAKKSLRTKPSVTVEITEPGAMARVTITKKGKRSAKAQA